MFIDVVPEPRVTAFPSTVPPIVGVVESESSAEARPNENPS